jgi:hypothetical protein
MDCIKTQQLLTSMHGDNLVGSGGAMKYQPTLVLLIFSGLSLTPLPGQETKLTGCAAKRQDLGHQIQQARASGDKKQQAGLEKALRKNEEVTRREADLKKAEAKGDVEKINKRKTKLADSQKELQDAQAELSQ